MGNFEKHCERGNVYYVMRQYKNQPEPVLTQGLYIACEKGHVSVVKVLLDNLKFSEFCLDKALQVACLHGRAGVVQLLVPRGVFVGNVDRSCLLNAVKGGFYEIVDILLKNIDYAPPEAFIIAVRYGNAAVLERLFKAASFDVDIEDLLKYAKSWNALVNVLEAKIQK